MFGVFAVFAPIHLLLSTAGRRDIVPPRFLAVIGWLAGLRIQVEGRPYPRPLLLLANHVSWLDIVALAGTAGTAFVGHGGLAGHRFLRWLCVQNDTVFIARERRGTITRQAEDVREAVRRRRLTIFPEGTTSDGKTLLPFKSALLSAVDGAVGAVTIQPVALDYDDAAGIAWFAAEPGMGNVRRILARTRPVLLTIRFLDPLDGADLADRKAIAAAARSAIAGSLAL